MNGNLDNIRKNLVSCITESLDSIGLMYRLFDRTKTANSIEKKLNADTQYGSTKLLQDLIGIRVVLYFRDDVTIVRDAIKKIYTERTEDQSIDHLGTSEFQARRFNLVFASDDDGWSEIKTEFRDKVDNTFEVQIRTVFSEGWHEVEHDLKYKFEDDWSSVPEFSRNMNGVLASLETNEWTMLRILEDLSYSHYKGGKIIEMFRQKLRLKLTSFDLSTELVDILSNSKVLKSFYRLDRELLLQKMIAVGFRYPLSLENIIYFSNYVFIRDSKILSTTPHFLIEEIAETLDVSLGLSQIGIAKGIAFKAHDGQKRRDGSPYINHPKAVAAMLTGVDEITTAWLHDVIEDSDLTEANLREQGIATEVVAAVHLLTRTQDVDYSDYISNIAKNPLARKVKIHDILHNLSDSPMPDKLKIYTESLRKLM